METLKKIILIICVLSITQTIAQDSEKRVNDFRLLVTTLNIEGALSSGQNFLNYEFYRIIPTLNLNYRIGYNNLLSLGISINTSSEFEEIIGYSIPIIYTQVLKTTFRSDGRRSSKIEGPAISFGFKYNFKNIHSSNNVGNNLSGYIGIGLFAIGLQTYVGYTFDLTKIKGNNTTINYNYFTLGLQFPLFGIN